MSFGHAVKKTIMAQIRDNLARCSMSTRVLEGVIKGYTALAVHEFILRLNPDVLGFPRFIGKWVLATVVFTALSILPLRRKQLACMDGCVR